MIILRKYHSFEIAFVTINRTLYARESILAGLLMLIILILRSNARARASYIFTCMSMKSCSDRHLHMCTFIHIYVHMARHREHGDDLLLCARATSNVIVGVRTCSLIQKEHLNSMMFENLDSGMF